MSKRGRSSIFSPDEQDYIITNYKDMKYKDIALSLGYTEKQVRGWINNHCSKKNRCFNDSAFSAINDPICAYFVGLIYADGWITYRTEDTGLSRGHELGMQLEVNDSYMLHILSSYIGGVHPVTYFSSHTLIPGNAKPSYSEMSSLRVYSKRIVTDLMRLGIAPNKTYSSEYPIVGDAYFSHFMRGYFDGDGCVYSNKRKSPVVHFTAYSDSFLEHLKNRMATLYGISSSVYKENDNKYRLFIFRNDCVRTFYSVIYDDADGLFLARKYAKFNNLYKGRAS